MVNHEREKLSPRQHYETFARALRLVNRIAAGVLPLEILRCLCQAATPFVTIYMSALILNELTGLRRLRVLMLDVAIAIGGTLLLVILQNGFNYFCMKEDVKINARHQILLANKSYALDYAIAERSEVNELRKLIETHARTGVGGLNFMREQCWRWLENAFSVGIALAISVGALRGGAWWMNLLLFACAAGAIVLISRAWARSNRAQRALNHNQTDLNLLFDFYSNAYLSENKAGKDVRIFHQSAFLLREFREHIWGPFYGALRKQMLVSGRANMLNAGLAAMLGGLVYLFVALQAWRNAMPSGEVLRCYGAVTQLIAAASALSISCLGLLNQNLCLKLLFDYLDLPEARRPGALPLQADAMSAPIAFEHVSFRYGEDSLPALDDVSLTLEPGQRVAIVGRNGSGKTTLIKLLCRLYAPKEGRITLGGVDVQRYDHDDYQQQFATVFQDFRLFAFPVGQNIAGSVAYDGAKVWRALELAGMKERAEQFPKGLEQTLYKEFEEDGVDLSGGEEQKLAIARALYKDAPFVILDEPTAALDPFSEAEIYEKFDEIVGGKTAVYISHRLSSCQFCDRIYVMDKGKIVQSGSHIQLLAEEDGLYARLWAAQAQYYARPAMGIDT